MDAHTHACVCTHTHTNVKCEMASGLPPKSCKLTRTHFDFGDGDREMAKGLGVLPHWPFLSRTLTHTP